MKKTEPLWVHLEIPISTSKENIWSALTLPDHTKKYMFNCALKCSWVIGSEVEWIETFDDYTKQFMFMLHSLNISPTEVFVLLFPIIE